MHCVFCVHPGQKAKVKVLLHSPPHRVTIITTNWWSIRHRNPHTKALASLTKVSADIIVNFFDNYWILHDQLRILVFFKKDRSKCLLYLHISYFLFWNTNTRKDYYVINELQHLRCDFGGLMNSINFKTVFCITAMHLSHSKTTVSLNITDGKVEVYTLMLIPPIFV